MPTIQQIENTVSEVLSAGGFADASAMKRVDEFGGDISVEVVMNDAARAEEARAALEQRFAGLGFFLNVRGVWQIEHVGEPQIAYGPNGSPRAAVMVPFMMRSGETRRDVTVAITKLAEMELERILGETPDLQQVAQLVVENKLRLGGSSSWDPAKDAWLEVTSANAAGLTRGLRRIA